MLRWKYIVGNTRYSGSGAFLTSVHPHVCGEHGLLLAAASALLRFIPTCVGNTTPAVKLLGISPVHPHVCGEHSNQNVHHPGISGSSPRVWGTHHDNAFNLSIRRFIPTCVGNTISAIPETQVRSVHPHVCGEHGISFSGCSPISGSSPRVWGTLPVWPVPQPSHRFIPTCVGNTPPPAERRKRMSVHPHVCGEHSTRHVFS